MNAFKERAPVLFQLAQFISESSHELSDGIYHQAKRVLADTIGVAFAGIKTEAFQAAFQQKNSLFGKGNHQIWGLDTNSSLGGAIFFNSLAVSSTDFDEGHRYAVGHPASVVIPIAMCLGEYLNKTRQEILYAIVLGYEMACRFSGSRNKEHINSYSSGKWGALGAATTASILLGLKPEQCMHALSNAYLLGPNMLGGSTDVSTGAMSKEGVAWAVQSGFQSSLMASKGFAGPWLFVDEHPLYHNEELLRKLGEEWLISSNYFKPYACCRWLHAAIKAASQLKKQHAFDSTEINTIHVQIFTRAIDLVDRAYPTNSVMAQFHLPFALASVLTYDQLSPQEFKDERLHEKPLKELMDKIQLIPQADYDQGFPERLTAKVSIALSEGRHFSHEETDAPWDAHQPASDEELQNKFYSLVPNSKKDLWTNYMDS